MILQQFDIDKDKAILALLLSIILVRSQKILNSSLNNDLFKMFLRHIQLNFLRILLLYPDFIADQIPLIHLFLKTELVRDIFIKFVKRLDIEPLSILFYKICLTKHIKGEIVSSSTHAFSTNVSFFSTHDNAWLLDIGANHHLTLDSVNVLQSLPYNESE